MVALGRDAVRIVPLLGARGVGIDALVDVPNLKRRRKALVAQVVGIRLLVEGRRIGQRDGLCRRLRHHLEPQLPRNEAGNLNPIGADAATRGEILELVGRVGLTNNTIPSTVVANKK